MITSHGDRIEEENHKEEQKRINEEKDRKVSWQTHESIVSSFIQNECMKFGFKYLGPEDFPDR